VDLVLSQGMLGAGWHAHSLNAPAKFLVSAPEHGTPKRACAYLVTDDDVASVVAYHGRLGAWSAIFLSCALHGPGPGGGLAP
jgi:hypothetical protein